jgi:hypothetical protein
VWSNLVAWSFQHRAGEGINEKDLIRLQKECALAARVHRLQVINSA